MTLSVQSAVYQQPSTHSSFAGSQLEQDRLNPHHQDYRSNVAVQSYSASTQHIPSVNINAAIASSLKLKNASPPSQKMDSSLDLLNKIISFHKSPATPLDTIIKVHIERMPNSTVLLNPRSEKSVGCPKAPYLFSDTELIKCCKDAQSALPRVNLGFRNTGNTCYLNAVLQCLLATGALLYFVREKHSKPGVCVYANNKNGQRFCALCALFRLFQEHGQQNNHSLLPQSGSDFLNRTSFGSTTPALFATNVRAVCPNLRVYAQEDAHEYLLGLLSRMEESVVTGVGKLPRSILDTNVIRRIFGGVTRSEVTCNTCHKVSLRNDQWFNLSMDITFARSLQQCLVNYTQTEILQGANAYKCETCQQLRHAKRCCRVFRAPPILIVQFNRFSRSQKLDFHIDFPASFNMRPHMTSSSGPPVLYHLYATLNHEGITCRSGHYVAFSKRRNQWFFHNDNIVTSTTQEYVLRQAPYLLFYQLASPEAVLGLTSVGNNVDQFHSDTKPLSSAPASTSSQSGPSRKALSEENIDVASIPLPPGPVRPKPAVTFHPRVLAKPTPLISQSSSASYVGVPVPKTPESHVSQDNEKLVETAIDGKATVNEATGAADVSLSHANRSFSVTTNVSPLQKTRKSNSPKHLNGGSHFKQDTESSHLSSSSNTAHSRSTVAISSSSGSESTESSVEWVPMTKTDLLMQQQPSRKRTHGECSSVRSPSSSDGGGSAPPKIPRKDCSEEVNILRRFHYSKRHKKLRSHRRKHRHHRKHRHKRRRSRGKDTL
ncbi:Ubiquitin hydrolase [Echinococcus granulosus]|uniref:Ubiquitin carboxyl-terminal hydrolase n=1 Tax=Echinococcus granulosus TaxID=6210 RepID=W6UD27_ECHGR|nr:Ubiquitin hydrolase [Echinococcus granulosus]EUB56212.1 Ubiquitin hydrolase [Echinococcus granulosus]